MHPKREHSFDERLVQATFYRMGGVCSPVVGMAQPSIISRSPDFDDLPADALEPARWCNPKNELPNAAYDASATESFLRTFAKRRRQSYHPSGRAAPELFPTAAPAPPLLPTTTPPPLPRRAISPPPIVRRPATARVAGEHPAPLLPEMKDPVLAESVSAPRAWAPSRPPPVRTSSSASGSDLRRIAAAAAFLARGSVDELLGDIRIDDDDDLDRVSFSSWAADCDPTSPRTPTSSFVC